MILVISNYEQAIAWLGATENMDDSFIVALHCNKVSWSVGRRKSDIYLSMQWLHEKNNEITDSCTWLTSFLFRSPKTQQMKG